MPENKIDSKELINFSSLARLLEEERTNVRAVFVPKRHQEKVNDLVKHIEKWRKKWNLE